MPLDGVRDGLIALQGQLIVLLVQRNAELEARVGEMEERLARLERSLSRNSGNSGMAPSSDDLPGKKAPEPKPKRTGKKRQGKQPGAPGAHLAWSRDPDETRDLFPRGLCGCGMDLADAADLGSRRRTRSSTPRP